MSQAILPPDAIDDLLSGFFKSKMHHPWPAAPATGSIEPGSLRSVHHAGANGNRARLTLAVSVALLLGTCWFLSHGSNPGDRTAPQAAPGGPAILNEGSAKMPKEFDKKKPADVKGTGPMLN
jgi:hypothetical protein